MLFRRGILFWMSLCYLFGSCSYSSHLDVSKHQNEKRFLTVSSERGGIGQTAIIGINPQQNPAQTTQVIPVQGRTINQSPKSTLSYPKGQATVPNVHSNNKGVEKVATGLGIAGPLAAISIDRLENHVANGIAELAYDFYQSHKGSKIVSKIKKIKSKSSLKQKRKPKLKEW